MDLCSSKKLIYKFIDLLKSLKNNFHDYLEYHFYNFLTHFCDHHIILFVIYCLIQH